MPYILIHPLPPPKRNPYAPDLPTFTTSSRPIAHFFHSHGWRALHTHADSPPPPSPPPSPESPRSNSHSSTHSTNSLSYVDAPTLSPSAAPATQRNEYCRASTSTSSSAVVACGRIAELHCYGIPVNGGILYGPGATARQLRFLRYYAYPHISFEECGGGVDLRRVNEEGVALQRGVNAEFWGGERCKERGVRKIGDADGCWGASEVEEVRARDVQSEGCFVRTQRGLVMAEGRVGLLEMGKQGDVVKPKGMMTVQWRVGTPADVKEDDDDAECPQLVSADQDEEIDEELGEQWELYERASLASEGLEWAEDGKTLRKRKDTG